MTDAGTTVVPRRSARFPSPATRLPALTRTRRLHLQLALATVFYLGFACYVTRPLVTDLGHNLYGAPGDPYGAMAFFRALAEHHHNPFLPGTLSQFAAPEGQPIPWPRDLASAPEVLTLYLLTALFGAIPAYSLNALASYTLTGTATFLFARRLTANTWASLIAGWAFAFYPFAALNGQVHPDGISGWVLVLAVWRLVELLWYPTRRNGVLAGAAVVFGMWWSAYFILFIGVTYIVITATTLALAARERRIRSVLVPQLIVALSVIFFLACLGALSTASGENIGIRTHSTQELAGWAAYPAQYFFPDDQSPLFGRYTRGYLQALRHHGTAYEDMLYLGITVILLAMAALVAFIRRRLTARLRRAVLVLWILCIAAIITSFPPEPQIFGVSVPLPAHFISQVSTTWRVYSRFVMVVMLALSTLAAIGLDALTRGRKPWVRVASMLCATIIVPLDLWSFQASHVEKVRTPSVYEVLAHQPMGLVAEYPLNRSEKTYRDVFFQGAYGKPLLNGYLEGSFQEWRALSLYDLASPTTAQRLATLGVRYVLVDSQPYGWGWPPAGEPGPGFRLLASEPYADLYVVTAHATSPALAAAGEGFTVVGLTENQPDSWLVQPSGTIALAGKCARCNGVLFMTLLSNVKARQVTILDSRGNALAHGVVGATAQVKVKVPLSFAGHTSLTLVATPGPQPAPSNNFEGSPSSASLQMIKLEFSAKDAKR
jgi:hypothetical protein